MKKFLVVVVLVFALGVGAEWFMLGNPQTGVVLWMAHRPASDTFVLQVQTSEGTRMNVILPKKVWQEWLQSRQPDLPSLIVPNPDDRH